MDKLLTLDQAAKLISVNRETLRRWDNDGKLVSIKLNDRGDRRYRESDILRLISNNRKSALYSLDELYKDFQISWYTDGFVSIPANFGLIAQILIRKNSETIGFAFVVSGFVAFERTGENDNLKKIALDVVRKYIDKQAISDGDVFTYEFSNGKFTEVQNPVWWQGKYSKTLNTELRLEANHSCPIAMDMKAWRVILNFKTKQGDLWLTTGFGPQNNKYEYFFWIDSESLLMKGLANTAKSAEIIAVETVKQRFENTRINEIRDISRINETNSAIYLGKTMTDEMLPDKFYSK